MYGPEIDDEDDVVTFLSVSTPRSRLGSEQLFEDIECIIQSSKQPPVGTTRPPLYPQGGFPRGTSSPAVMSQPSSAVPRKRSLKRLVNKPIKLVAASAVVQA